MKTRHFLQKLSRDNQTHGNNARTSRIFLKFEKQKEISEDYSSVVFKLGSKKSVTFKTWSSDSKRVNMSMLLFWAVKPSGLVSEKHTFSVFNATINQNPGEQHRQVSGNWFKSCREGRCPAWVTPLGCWQEIYLVARGNFSTARIQNVSMTTQELENEFLLMWLEYKSSRKSLSSAAPLSNCTNKKVLPFVYSCRELWRLNEGNYKDHWNTQKKSCRPVKWRHISCHAPRTSMG